MSDIKEQINRSAFRLRLAKKKIEALTKEIKEIGLSAKGDANFLNSLVLQKYFNLEFMVFMPSWTAFARLDEDSGKIVITHIERGLERVILTNKGWSYQPKGLLMDKSLCPPKDMITPEEMLKFCLNFYYKYGIEVEMMICKVLPYSNSLGITEDRRFHNG